MAAPIISSMARKRPEQADEQPKQKPDTSPVRVSTELAEMIGMLAIHRRIAVSELLTPLLFPIIEPMFQEMIRERQADLKKPKE